MTRQRQLKQKEIAEFLTVTPGAIKTLTEAGMPHIMVGKTPRYDREEVLIWFKAEMARCKHISTCKTKSDCKGCERKNCLDRPFGEYETKKNDIWGKSEFCKFGWKATWSNWYQNDSDFDEIKEQVK